MPEIFIVIKTDYYSKKVYVLNASCNIFITAYCHERKTTKPSSGFPTRCNTNQPVESLMKAKNLKFWIEVEKKL